MKIEGIVNEVSVEFHDELNPALWQNNEIKLDVQVGLLEIAKKFIQFLNVPDLRLVDIYFMGSNAAYVYTHFSDIDLHIIVDDPDDSRKELYDAKKRLWNDQHDISIKGYDVELYVQDIKDPNASMGIYSLLKNEWIKEPEKVEATIDDAGVQQKFKYLAKKIERGIKKRDLNYLDNIANEIKELRKSGLQRAGEFSVENLAFKELRNGGFLEKLSNARQELEDEELSLDEAAEEERLKKLKTRSRIRKGIGTKHVYNYELNVLYEIKRLAQQRSLKTLTNIASKIWEKYYPGKRKVPVIRFGPGDTTLGYPLSYTEGYGLIELAPGQQDILTLIHELVHAIGPALHGTSFTEKYYEILKDYLPAKVQKEVYDELVLRHGSLLKPYYKKMMAEAPVADFQPVGDFDKPGSFTTTKYDPAIVKNPKAQQKVYRFFEKSPYKFRLYPLNIPGARKFSETGKVDMNWLEQNLPQAAEIVKKNPPNDDIIVFYVSNVGSEKVPFTPWIMAHRMGHAFRPNNYAWGEFVSYWMEQMKQMLNGYYGADIGRMEDPRYIALQNALGTMKSAREGKITRPYEFLYELLAQYINTGSVKLNQMPEYLGYGKQAWGKHSRFIRLLPTDEAENKNHIEMLERDLDYHLDTVLSEAQNKIFVM